MIDVNAEHEMITRFDPEEQQYCEKLLDEIERLQETMKPVALPHEELKPCPFCGGEANIGTVKYAKDSQDAKLNGRNVGYYGQCISCSATMCFGLAYETKQIAAEKWNRRTGEVADAG